MGTSVYLYSSHSPLKSQLLIINAYRTEKSGYWLAAPNRVLMLTELMNAHPEPRTAVLSITYEYIPYLPPDFETVTSIWLDIGGCKKSEVPVPTHRTSFHFSSRAWKSTISGRILCVLGHLHDGGTTLDVRKGDE